jgi:hypothetical protein
MMMKVASLLSLLALAACASGGATRDNYYERFDAGFRRLGASEARGRCYSERLARADAETAADAARIIEESADKADMKSRVLNADEPTRQAFIRANFGCSLTG